jgi:hypothetical protein
MMPEPDQHLASLPYRQRCNTQPTAALALSGGSYYQGDDYHL